MQCSLLDRYSLGEMLSNADVVQLFFERGNSGLSFREK